MRNGRYALVALVVFFLTAPVHERPLHAANAAYETTFVHWRAADGGFAGWTINGAVIAAEGVRLDRVTAHSETDPFPALGYHGHNFYNGGSYLVGEAVSPEVPLRIPVREAIASWNADAPAGTWLDTLIRARIGSRWTKWYNLGVWARDSGTVERHSVSAQGDADGNVSVDTFVLDKKITATALQLKVRLFAASDSASGAVTLRNVGLTFSTDKPRKAAASAGDPSLWNVKLDVPECSQMVYPDGGTVWCSPTSTSMVLAYWNKDIGSCEPRVRAAVEGVYDWLYDGDGNWPFNTAYAAAAGQEAYVVRFNSMAQLEPWTKAGVPVVISYAWKRDLTGAPLPSSSGHLALLVGFDSAGNPVVNDPAAASDADVQRVYQRSQLEPLWLASSGGTVYLIFPSGQKVPAF